MKTKLMHISYLLIILTLASLAGWWWYSNPAPVFKAVKFNKLPGWEKAQFKQSLLAFQKSCQAFVRQDPERLVGTDQIQLKVKDWQPACRAALEINPVEENTAKQFFLQWFAPVEFYVSKSEKGLFTGYYMPSIKGSYTKTDEYQVPIYETPKDLVSLDLSLFIPSLKNRKIFGRIQDNKLIPYYTREEINQGAISENAKVLLWIKSPVDRVFLEIQGTGIIEFEDGSSSYIGYDAQNGAPYTSIAGVLIKKGVMTKDNASMQGIKRYLEAHPDSMDEVLNQNKSFIFFHKLTLDAALGSQGVALTPGYSLAIDRDWIPMGAPLWLSTTRPDSRNPDLNKPLQRLMVAQDTGGAIRGKVRGDVFWGGGNQAVMIAGHMKNEGAYWLFLPRHVVSKLDKDKGIN